MNQQSSHSQKLSWEHNIKGYFKKQNLTNVTIEPQCIAKLNEFALKYASEILNHSKSIANFQKRGNVRVDDVALAMKVIEDKYASSHGNQSAVEEIAMHKNQQKLPVVLDSSILSSYAS